MFNLADKYKTKKNLNKELFIKQLEGEDKKRYREAVKSIVIEGIISGEELPSRIDDKYNMQVIQFIKIKLDKMKDASLVAKAVQKEMKAPTVITLVDTEENSKLSFALKRLNELDKTQIVITAEIMSAEYNLRFGDSFSDLAVKYLNIENILNKQDKMTVYQELAVKTYILSNMKLFNSIVSLLDSKMWYNIERVAYVFECIKKIELLKKEVKQSYDIAEQGILNGEIKRLIGEVAYG